MKLMQSACAIFSVVFQGREGWGDVGGVECLQVAYWFGNISLFCGGRCLDSSVIPPFCFVCSLPLGDFVRFADIRLVLGLVATFLGAHPLGGAPDFSLGS